MAQPLALVPLGPGAAAIAACFGRQGVHPGQIDAGDEVFILCGAVVQIKLMVSIGGSSCQVPQRGKVKAGG